MSPPRERIPKACGPKGAAADFGRVQVLFRLGSHLTSSWERFSLFLVSRIALDTEADLKNVFHMCLGHPWNSKPVPRAFFRGGSFIMPRPCLLHMTPVMSSKSQLRMGQHLWHMIKLYHNWRVNTHLPSIFALARVAGFDHGLIMFDLDPN